MSPPPSTNGRRDVLTHRILVASLGTAVVLTVLSIAALAAAGEEVPPSLPALGSTALGALVGMLAGIMRSNGGSP